MRVTLLSVTAASIAWTIAASALVCTMSGQMDTFVFPWDNWWYCLEWFGLNWMATSIMIGSAILPMIPLLILAYAIHSFRNPRNSRPDLYGKIEFADRGEMNDNGIKTSRRLP